VTELVRPAFSVPVVLLSTAVTGRDEYGNDVREATETPGGRARGVAAGVG
jgi:hypothetical protein